MKQLIGDWRMSSSPQEPKRFTLWDWLAIFVVADLSSSAVISILAGSGAAIWILIIAWCLWWMHIAGVKRQIELGIR